MMSRLLSHDGPRSRVLAALLILIVLALALTPFLFPGTKALNVAAKIIVFIVLVASFDLLLGYTGIVSFAHTMFFGIGAYGVAIASTRLGPGWASLALGVGAALAVSLLLSLLIGLASLRVKAIFFAMITLAVASAFLTLASQLSDFTGGEDGLNFKVPEALQPGTSYRETPLLGASIDGRFATYYLLFFTALVLVLAMLRIVNSPFGRSARTTFAPRRSATAPWCGAPSPRCCRRCSPRSPAACSRCGCATRGRTPRCPSRSCWTSCSSS